MNLIKKFFIWYFIKYNIIGTNNTIIGIKNGRIFNIWKKKRNGIIKIVGNNNKIIIDFSNTPNKKVMIPDGLSINILGNDNTIYITMPINFYNSTLELKGNCNKFKLGYSKYNINDAKFYVYNGGSIYIGNNCQLGNGNLYIKIEDDGEIKHRIEIGDDTFIARECIIRASDGHTIYDNLTKLPINPPDNIIIGKNCWITSRCIIIKGTVLPDNTIVAANSFVNKKFTEEHILIAGSPAKIIRKNVFWDKRGFATYTKQFNNKYTTN